MSGLLDITAKTLGEALGFEVPEFFVIVAKSSVLGMSSESIRETLQCSVEELREIESDEQYKQVRLFIAGRQTQMTADQAASWDQIENIALSNLIKRMPFEKDGDFLLRVAAVANKAQRRTQRDTGVLDPSAKTGRRVITLTQRLVKSLSRDGDATQQEIRELSISDGSMGTPTFEEVDSLLTVSNRPVLSREIEVQTRNADPTFEELNRALHGD